MTLLALIFKRIRFVVFTVLYNLYGQTLILIDTQVVVLLTFPAFLFIEVNVTMFYLVYWGLFTQAIFQEIAILTSGTKSMIFLKLAMR